MKIKFKQLYTRFIEIMKDTCGEATLEVVSKILVSPAGYDFLSKAREKYAVELGMLNHLLKAQLISANEYSNIKGIMKRKYNIKADF